VYVGDWRLRLSRAARQARPAAGWRVPANVWGLGVTSLLTDISSEMVVSVLPAYLVLTTGFAPMLLGLATGLHEGGPLLVTWIGGWLADRSGRRKLTALIGYGLSMVCRLGWLVLSPERMSALAALVLSDRMGKAIRTAPRDALISLSTPKPQLATAFGVHRAMDATGAALGPILGFLLLWQFPRRFDIIFFSSFVAAILGLAALGLLVQDVEQREEVAVERMRGVGFALLRDGALRRVVILASAFGLVTISDAFVYVLLIQRSQADAGWIPLFYTGTAVAFLLLAVPMGALADHLGRGRVFVAAHVPLLLVYAMVLTGVPSWPWNAVFCVMLLGTYYAGSDGVLAGLASSLLPAPSRAMGLAWVDTATSVARFVSAIGFGVIWTRGGDVMAVSAFAAALAIVFITMMLFRRTLFSGLGVLA
jgi:MFS family permease